MFLHLGRLAQHNCFLHFLRITLDKSSKYWISIPPFAGHCFLVINAHESRQTASTSPISAHHVVLAAVIVTGLDKVMFSIAHTDYHQEKNHFVWVSLNLDPWITGDQMKMNLVQISLHEIYCKNRETRLAVDRDKPWITWMIKSYSQSTMIFDHEGLPHVLVLTSHMVKSCGWCGGPYDTSD